MCVVIIKSALGSRRHMDPDPEPMMILCRDIQCRTSGISITINPIRLTFYCICTRVGKEQRVRTSIGHN